MAWALLMRPFDATVSRQSGKAVHQEGKMRKSATLVVLVLGLSAGVPEPSEAEQFVVTAPSIFGFAPDGDRFHFTGAGLDVRPDPFLFFGIEAIAGGGCLGDDPVGSQFNCTAGDLIDMSVRTAGEVSMGAGTATIDGTTYEDVSFFGDLNFSATPSLFPESSDDVVFFHQPFLFNGALRGLAGGQEVFNIDLTGTGLTARAFFRTADGTYNYQMESITAYAFDAAAAPTPEPTSLLLLGSGLGLLARARRRRA